MLRIPTDERSQWQKLANDYGFTFHTMYGEPYWDESAYYQFTLPQIEKDIEDPTAELHQMCLSVVEDVVKSEELLEKFQIPKTFWQPIKDSWDAKEPSLYSRLDLVYDGKSPVKLLENNADTPTSLYETGFWQWLWLEQKVDSGAIHRNADQFNSLQEKLVNRFAQLRQQNQISFMHFASCRDTDEDRGTVQYIQDCAKEAGVKDYFVNVEDIGLSDDGEFTDGQSQQIEWLFKLYPWEFMQRESFAEFIPHANTRWLEPLWKSIISNKALLPMLWKLFPNHPNLLPSWFEDELSQANASKLVRKPIFSREGANISILDQESKTTIEEADGPYGEEGYIYQEFHSLPKFADNYTLIGSWLIDDQPAGISLREDKSLITQDLSRYLPHIIL